MTAPALWRSPRLYAVLAVLLVAIAVARIVSTYREFNATFDEPAHLATGMEWLDKGQYTIESLHPPLARVAVALGPWLDGIRSQGHNALWREAYFVMYSGEDYYRTLTLMRLGVIPFFLLLCFAVWMWTRRLYGEEAAVIAVGLTTLLPPVLAHASVATTDMALTATLLLTFFAFARWLHDPGWQSSAALGAAGGLAVLSKFSAGPFLVVGGALYLAARLILPRTVAASPDVILREPSRSSAKQWTLGALTALAVSLLVIWAGYRFSVANIGGLPLPAPEFVKGLYKVAERNGLGLDAYLLGELRTHGWWYFFPVTIAVKTPIAFLVLAIAGGVFAIRRSVHTHDWLYLAPLLGAGAVLGFSMISNINIGVRHVLPVYPLLAIGAAGVVVELWRSTRRRQGARVVVAIAITWLSFSSMRAHPDYIAWFNELAGDRPDRILVNGDLDWGQDLDRLADTLNARGITSVRIAYFGSASPPKHIQGAQRLSPHERPPGWVAVSEAVIKGVLVSPTDGFRWADSIPPVARVGKSIRLYHFK